MAPKVIGPYRVLETLGSGGVGTVYRSVDRRTGDVAALKLLSTGPALDPRAARRLAREFETLQRLSHPNVVKVYDTGVYQGYPYLAMELVEGLTLRHYLALAEDDLASDAALSRAISAHRTLGNTKNDTQDESDADEEDENVNSGISSGQLSNDSIQAGLQQLLSGGARSMSVPSNMSNGQSGAVSGGLFGDLMRQNTSRNASEYGRAASQQQADMQHAFEVARANGGLQQMQLLSDTNRENVTNQVTQRNTVLDLLGQLLRGFA